LAIPEVRQSALVAGRSRGVKGLVDRVFAAALADGFAGPMPQLMLLLADDPIKAILHDAEEPTLAEPGQIGDRTCYRV